MTFLNFTFQESSPVINYFRGQWQEINPALDPLTSNYALGSAEVTDDGEAAATVTFTGTSITIFGAKRTNHGNYSVTLDNGLPFIGNGTADNIFQTPLWGTQNLANTQHTVVITNIPTSQEQQWLDLDFVTIGREIGPPGYTGSIVNMTLDDQSSLIEYSGSWSFSSSSGALNNSLHQTFEEGSSLSMFFHGSSIEFYGLYINAPFQVKLNDQPAINIAGANVNTTWQPDPQTLLFYADGLDENQTHIVSLINAVSNPDIPLYFDYAIVRGSQAFFVANSSTMSVIPKPTPNSSTMSIVPKPTPTDTIVTPPSQPAPVGIIVGSILGSIGGLVVLAFMVFFLIRRLQFHRRSTAVKLTGKGDLPPVFVPREYTGRGEMPFTDASTTQITSPMAEHSICDNPRHHHKSLTNIRPLPYPAQRTNLPDSSFITSTSFPNAQSVIPVNPSNQSQTDTSNFGGYIYQR